MKYDAILCIDEMVCEDDSRLFARKQPSGVTKFFKGSADYDDPKLYNNFSFGQTLRSLLNNMGEGFSCKVTDFGKWVTAELTHHNHITGRSASKTFLIVFKYKGDGIVLSTHNRYRTISGVDQAASYIKSAASTLQGNTQSKF